MRYWYWFLAKLGYKIMSFWMKYDRFAFRSLRFMTPSEKFIYRIYSAGTTGLMLRGINPFDGGLE